MKTTSGNEDQELATETNESPRHALEHGFRLCRAPHMDDKFAKPHCECGKSHEANGFTLPEQIFTVGGSDGRFFSRRGGFAQVEYVLKHNKPERDAETDQD